MKNMSNEKITGAQALVKALEHSGVDVMFGIPGGAILPAYDPIYDSPIRHILVRHVLVMLQLVMRKQLVALEFALQLQDLAQQT
jgi:hypothetical protein